MLPSQKTFQSKGLLMRGIAVVSCSLVPGYRVSVSCVGLLLMLATVACSSRSDSANSDANQRLEQIEQSLQNLASKSAQPAGLEYQDKLKEIEAALLGGNRDATQVAAEYLKLRESLPALAAFELALPLAKIDWLLEMETLFAGESTAESLSEAEVLLEQIPESIGDTIAQKYSSQHAERVIAFVTTILAAQDSDEETLALASEMLDRLEPTAEPQAGVEELKSTLASQLSDQRRAALAEAVKADVAELELQLAKATEIADVELKNAVMVSLNQSIDNLRVQLVLQGHTTELGLTDGLKTQLTRQLEETYQVLSSRQQEDLRRARMKYQAWALQEIERLNALIDQKAIDAELYRLRDSIGEATVPPTVPWLSLEGVRAMLESSIGKTGQDQILTPEQQKSIGDYVSENWYEINYQVVHDAAVIHLLTIEPGLLEPPVAKFYNEAFEKVWSALGERPALRLSLARKTAEVSRRGLENLK